MPDNIDLQELCLKVVETAKEAGRYILSESPTASQLRIEEKDVNSLVSKVDRQAEKMIVEALLKLLPDSGLLTEEDTENIAGRDYTWIIDPLDGTTNFLFGIPCYSVSIALQHKESVVLGVVYEIRQDECFYAWRSGGAYLNDHAIHVTKTSDLAKTLIGTGFPYNDFSLTDSYLGAIKYFIEHTRGVRRIGSAAVDLIYVACGRFDSFFEYGLHPWDVAAGAFIVQEAGGKVTDFSGDNNYVYGGEIVSSNALIHEEVTKVIQQYF